MTPHKQLNRHRPEEGIWGDCQRSVYACLLDRHPSEVPHFMEYGGAKDDADIEHHIDMWLADEGLVEYQIAFDGDAMSLDDVLRCVGVMNPGLAGDISGPSLK
ncbi:MAG: hypothetical protein OXC29_22410, partial [Rhodococcus sp.]|nr:hypothetical protein [Rhodococcus sp. (in: high G+C Gram-positive bacteria)]